MGLRDLLKKTPPKSKDTWALFMRDNLHGRWVPVLLGSGICDPKFKRAKTIIRKEFKWEQLEVKQARFLTAICKNKGPVEYLRARGVKPREATNKEYLKNLLKGAAKPLEKLQTGA